MIPALDYFAQYVKFLFYLLFCLFEKTIEYDVFFFFYFLLPVSPPHSQLTRFVAFARYTSSRIQSNSYLHSEQFHLVLHYLTR